jgi:hypothetical protein
MPQQRKQALVGRAEILGVERALVWSIYQQTDLPLGRHSGGKLPKVCRSKGICLAQSARCRTTRGYSERLVWLFGVRARGWMFLKMLWLKWPTFIAHTLGASSAVSETSA